jgi:type IV secretion system protein TrbG
MHALARFVLALPLTASLAACAAWPVPAKSKPRAFQPAKLLPDPPSVAPQKMVIDRLPHAGQLVSTPSTNPVRNDPPLARVKAANRAALEEPQSDAYINAIQVYPYFDGALYRLYTAPQEVSDIALQPGETLTAISAGDTTRWVVGNTTSGSGANKQVHILAKPFAPNLHTNLVITTDRRCYHLALESTAHTYMAAISWTYPDDGLVKSYQTQGASSMPPADSLSNLNHLNFNYAISGDDPPWRPLRAFDDGTHVYVEFPRDLDTGEAPPLFVKGANGGDDLVNYRVHGNYYIVDQLFSAAELRLGQDHQQVVRIKRDGHNQTVAATAGNLRDAQ